jgi:hypothetical protein
LLGFIMASPILPERCKLRVTHLAVEIVTQGSFRVIYVGLEEKPHDGRVQMYKILDKTGIKVGIVVIMGKGFLV